MISTEAKDSDQTKAYQAGANLYIIKPTRPDVLINNIRLLLGESGV
jgi:two-component system chemotaxis response regulator CheY